jgi:hypothetical protein
MDVILAHSESLPCDRIVSIYSCTPLIVMISWQTESGTSVTGLCDPSRCLEIRCSKLINLTFLTDCFTMFRQEAVTVTRAAGIHRGVI